MQTVSFESIAEFLTQVTTLHSEHPDYQYRCMEELVLQKGLDFCVAAQSSEYPLGSARQCYMNVYHLARRYPELTYVEGYAWWHAVSFPVLHAWAITKEGHVIEPTWRGAEGNVAYRGIPFQMEFIHQTMLRTKAFGVLDDYKSKFPTLRADFNWEQATVRRFYEQGEGIGCFTK